jgi:hypothetical protein
LKKEYTRRLRIMLKSELNPKNKFTTIGALTFPVLRYNFGIINWRLEETRKIDRKTRKVLTVYKMHHRKADVDKLYVKKERRRKRPIRNISDIQSRDNSYCRISEHKI